MKELRPEESITAWAFRFLQTIPEVTVTLSGMSNFQQLKENIETYETEKALNEEEMKAVLGAADSMIKGTAVPCTACHYCTSHCPQQLDIPKLLSMYNEHSVTGGGFLPTMFLATLPEEKRPGACVGCRSCEAVCPQQIKISEALADFVTRLS